MHKYTNYRTASLPPALAPSRHQTSGTPPSGHAPTPPAGDIWWSRLDTCLTCSLEDTPPPWNDIWCWSMKHVRFASGRYSSYWNAFLFDLVVILNCKCRTQGFVFVVSDTVSVKMCSQSFKRFVGVYSSDKRKEMLNK